MYYKAYPFWIDVSALNAKVLMISPLHSKFDRSATDEASPRDKWRDGRTDGGSGTGRAVEKVAGSVKEIESSMETAGGKASVNLG